MAQHEAKKATAWRHLCSKFNDQLFQPQSGGTFILAPQPPFTPYIAIYYSMAEYDRFSCSRLNQYDRHSSIFNKG